jgi:serine/threonine-protein kinase RsbW
MEIKMVLYLPRDAVSVPVSRQVLNSCLETLGVTPDTRADIALALSEACANVIQHAGPGEEYEVLVSARDHRCTIEVVNTGSQPGESAPEAVGAADALDARGPGGDLLDQFGLGDDPVPADAEHGRGLKIIDAVTENLQLTGNRQGTTLHFEKTLEWLPGAAGRQLLTADSHS